MDEGIPAEEGERASHTQQDSEHVQGIGTYLISSEKGERTALLVGGVGRKAGVMVPGAGSGEPCREGSSRATLTLWELGNFRLFFFSHNVSILLYAGDHPSLHIYGFRSFIISACFWQQFTTVLCGFKV